MSRTELQPEVIVLFHEVEIDVAIHQYEFIL